MLERTDKRAALGIPDKVAAGQRDIRHVRRFAIPGFDDPTQERDWDEWRDFLVRRYRHAPYSDYLARPTSPRYVARPASPSR